MGLKREHRENLNRLSRDQEVALFNVRGEHAQRLSETDEKLVQLEETVVKLQQELDRYKTLSDIQVRQKVNVAFKVFPIVWFLVSSLLMYKVNTLIPRY
jgi:hypothetical protein